MELISPAVIIILGCTALLLLLQWKNLRRPPCIRGWIPWIGAGFEFRKAPLEFIEKARITYGPIFTIFAVGKRMTFVTEEEGIEVFLTSKKVDFELAIQSPVYRTASIPKNIFFALHEKLYIVMKGKMGTSNLYQFIEQITEELHEQLENLGTHGTMEMNILVRYLLYPATVNVLFKKGFFPTNKKEVREFCQHFQAYDEGFEYGSQIPECFLRSWSKSKEWFRTLFEKNIPDIKTCKSAKDNSMTLLQAVLDVIEMETNGQNGPNYGLLLLWASLSNAVPNYTVPSGDFLMLSPFWLHRNPKHFPEPELFKPERWKKANLEKHAFLDGFVAFGSGKYQCPGRWFALLEIQLLIILILYKYECSLLDPLPKQTSGSQPGAGIRITWGLVRSRNNGPQHQSSRSKRSGKRTDSASDRCSPTRQHKYAFSGWKDDICQNQSSLHLLGVQQPEGQCRIEYKQRK
ncbi:24-hydroxycholesterol 7-alpha-hydroxylase isoform X5 [Choloepus didactylus]|uniref:24-hydroxycholesterol 7-alpha-hydroxylase isoform X5 n=1 Tax=Choloepus didactylus TaxID=27675 RepID=UPI00189DE318|nr:24-hydroxycholesterol 7-alpha-hydroxylase isoform X5 [Choloepus didactylus]